MEEKCAAVVVVGDQVEFVLGLEGVAETHYVWVTHLEQYISLAFGVLNLAFFRD